MDIAAVLKRLTKAKEANELLRLEFQVTRPPLIGSVVGPSNEYSIDPNGRVQQHWLIHVRDHEASINPGDVTAIEPA